MIRPAKREDITDMLLLLQQLFGIEEDFQFDAVQQAKGLVVDAYANRRRGRL